MTHTNLTPRGMFARLEQKNDDTWDIVAVFPASQVQLVKLKPNEMLTCGCGSSKFGECQRCEPERLGKAA